MSAASGAATGDRWLVTTRDQAWQERDLAGGDPAPRAMPDIYLAVDEPRQVIDGFGTSFSEIAWNTLQDVPDVEREALYDELFVPGEGLNLALGRTPIGGNDYSIDWYSYDEEDGDFALDRFSIDRDREALIPFIRSALSRRPDLRIWASPWSPPTWMKVNRHYAGAQPSPWHVDVVNGLRDDQVCDEGTDMFRQEDRYFAAYAEYFVRFVEAYRAAGIDIAMVMPQNEFNSPQVFPSCTWTPEGLARFSAHLAPRMAEHGVETFIGTLERPDAHLVDPVLDDEVAGPLVAGVGMQWAGKRAVPGIRYRAPHLRIYQTEQECGDGRNDWRYCRYAWTQLRDYIRNGAHGYMYWNTALPVGGRSRWGWTQNSLVTVQPDGSILRNPEYYLLKHASHFVTPGARYVDSVSLNGFENQIAFLNPDGSVVVVLHNDSNEPQSIRISVNGRILALALPADSFNTLRLAPDTR